MVATINVMNDSCYFKSIIDALGNALESSVNMMEKYFDKVTFTLSDSEDDEEEGHRRWENS